MKNSLAKTQEQYDKTVNRLLNEYSFEGQFKDDDRGSFRGRAQNRYTTTKPPKPGSAEERVYNKLKTNGDISIEAWDEFIDEKYGEDAKDISYDESLEMIGELFGMELDASSDSVWWIDFEG